MPIRSWSKPAKGDPIVCTLRDGRKFYGILHDRSEEFLEMFRDDGLPGLEMGPLVKWRWSEVKGCTKVELDSDYGYDVDEFQNQD